MLPLVGDAFGDYRVPHVIGLGTCEPPEGTWNVVLLSFPLTDSSLLLMVKIYHAIQNQLISKRSVLAFEDYPRLSYCCAHRYCLGRSCVSVPLTAMKCQLNTRHSTYLHRRHIFGFE
jgi:hypothetical protein